LAVSRNRNMVVVIAKTGRCKTYHVVRPISVAYATDPSEYVVMCGQNMDNYEEQLEYDSYEDIPDDISVCKTCLVSAGVIQSPKLNSKQ